MFHEESFYQYLALERRFSPHTLSAYRNDLSQFIADLTERQCLTSVAEVRHLHVRAWAVSQLESGISPRSVNRRLSCLKTWFHYLKKRGLIDKDPMRKVVSPKTGQRLPVYIQEDQMPRLLDPAAFSSDYKGQCHRLILEILYAAGLRRSELAALTIGDIDLGRSVFRIQGKGGKARLVPFARYLSILLEAFLALRREAFPAAKTNVLLLDRHGNPVKPDYIYRVARKHLSLVTTVEQRSPHVIRHSFATHLSNHGADLKALKDLLGHASLAATQVYLHNNIERLKQVYEQAHPKSREDTE